MHGYINPKHGWQHSCQIAYAPAVLLVYTSERLNKALAHHWQSFAGQPYFDRNGIFISAVLSAPLVLDMLIIMVSSFLSKTGRLLHLLCSNISSDTSLAMSTLSNCQVDLSSWHLANIGKCQLLWCLLAVSVNLQFMVFQVCYLLNLSSMLVQMKRQELRHKAKLQSNGAHRVESKKTS